MNKVLCVMALSAAWLISACTVPVHEDYPKYLENSYGQTTFPMVDETTQYYLFPATEKHSYNIRSVRAGLLFNTWKVKFGRIIDSTMKSAEIKTAFRSVEKVYSPHKSDGLLLTFDLRKYEFRGFQARVTLGIAAKEDGRYLLTKTYNAVGRSQGGKIFWGGSLAMKNAVQQSTKSAVDQIFSSFVLDLNKAVAVARLDSRDAPAEAGEGIGRELDELEKGTEEETQDDETITSKDPESDSSESVTAKRDDTAGEYCREYQSTVTIDGRTQETFGTACRQPDGNWRIVN